MSTVQRHRSLAGPGADGERRQRSGGQGVRSQGFRAVGVMASKLAAPVVAKRGGGILVRLKADWSAIVGPEWAVAAWPAALGRDGALKLRTAPAAALELQHLAPLLIERVNLFFGRPAVTRLVLVQGALPRPPAPVGPERRRLAASEAAALDRRVAVIANPELRAALVRLGKAVAEAAG
jgi:hypothetical protein